MVAGTPPKGGVGGDVVADAGSPTAAADAARATREELGRVGASIRRGKGLVEWLNDTPLDDEKIEDVKDEVQFELRLELERMVCYVRDAGKGVDRQEQVIQEAHAQLSSAKATIDQLNADIAKYKEKEVQGPILAARAARNLLLSGGESIHSPRPEPPPAATPTPPGLVPHRPRAKPNTLPSLSRNSTPTHRQGSGGCSPGCGCTTHDADGNCPHKEMMANRIIDGVFDQHTTLLRQRLRAAEEELKRFKDGSALRQVNEEADARVRAAEAKLAEVQATAERDRAAADAERQALLEKTIGASREQVELQARLAQAEQQHRKQMTDTAVAAQQVLDRLRKAQQNVKDEQAACEELRTNVALLSDALAERDEELGVFHRFAAGVKEWVAQLRRGAHTFHAACKRGGKGREWQELFPKDTSVFFATLRRGGAGAVAGAGRSPVVATRKASSSRGPAVLTSPPSAHHRRASVTKGVIRVPSTKTMPPSQAEAHDAAAAARCVDTSPATLSSSAALEYDEGDPMIEALPRRIHGSEGDGSDDADATDVEGLRVPPPMPHSAEPAAVEAMAACQPQVLAVFHEVLELMADIRTTIKEQGVRLAASPDKAGSAAHAYGGGESTIQKVPLSKRDAASMRRRPSAGVKEAVVVHMQSGNAPM